MLIAERMRCTPWALFGLSEPLAYMVDDHVLVMNAEGKKAEKDRRDAESKARR